MTYLDRTITVAPALAARPAPLRPAETGYPELAPLVSVLVHMMEEARSIVVNITSVHGGAGTSSVARKLAGAAAATGWCRVALLDAQPGMNEPGQGLIDAIERGDSPALTRRPLGAMEIDTGRLSSGSRPLSQIDSVRKLYGILRDRYALVIVDCPAVLVGQQTLTIAAAADETVLVVEAERTALTDVARARHALERRGAGVLGMVMNKSRLRIPARFGGIA